MKLFKVFYSSTYFTLLAYIVFFARRRRNHHFNYETNFLPIKYSIDTFLSISPTDKFEIYNFYLNLFGNILLFIPFSIILITAFKIKRLKWIISIAFLVSICIETLQYLFQVGLADIDDVILNLLGAITGYFIYKAIIQINWSIFLNGLFHKKRIIHGVDHE
ncbi:MAG: VanZ family protein [Ginsengibacter sp.]